MIPEHYPIEVGKIYGGEYPGDEEPDIAKYRLRYLVELGVRTFLDLTGADDEVEPYDSLLVELEREWHCSLWRIAMPLDNMGLPNSPGQMHSILTAIRDSVASGQGVFIHCSAGIGRTGTVVGCWLRECGFEPEVALARLQSLYSENMPKAARYPESPDTPVQVNYVRQWKPILIQS